jgi:hypothetical protein
MVYMADQKIITLKEFKRSRFVTLLNDLKVSAHQADSRNADWFEWLPQQFEDPKYLEWFFFMHGNNFVTFSTIQEYYDGCYRILTRTYLHKRYRRFCLPKDKSWRGYGAALAVAQLEYLNARGWDTIFVSMQGLKRRKTIERWKAPIEDATGLEWHLADDMYQTSLPIESPDAFQNIVYSGVEPKLKKMAVSTYRSLHEE